MMRARFFLIAVTLLITGCTTHTPPMNEYILSYPSEAPSPVESAAPYSLKIAPPKARPSLISKLFYYREGENKIGSYLYSQWVDTPAAMLDRLLYTSLQQNRLFNTTLSSGSSASGDLLLESMLHDFSHRIDNAGHSVGEIDITYTLIDTKTKKVIGSKRFTASSPAPSVDAQGGVIALDHAATHIIEQCAAWLYLISKEPSWKK